MYILLATKYSSNIFLSFFLFQSQHMNSDLLFGTSNGPVPWARLSSNQIIFLKRWQKKMIIWQYRRNAYKAQSAGDSCRTIQNVYCDSTVSQFIILNFRGQFLVENIKELNVCSTATLALDTIGGHLMSQTRYIRYIFYSWYHSWNL